MLNALTDAGVLTENRLFSTLDSTTRRFELPGGPSMLLSDTVGFVRRLPHQLVEAFRSTLQETADADLLIHVVDASDEGAPDQIAAVREVLESIDAGSLPELLVLNKADAADPVVLNRLSSLYPHAAVISAKTGQGIDDLHHALVAALNAGAVSMDLLVPYDRGDVVAGLRRDGEVVEEHHTADGTELHARVPAERAHRYAEFTRP